MTHGTAVPRIVRARAERFGAILAIESPAATVSVDRALARRLGVDGGALWDGAAPRMEDVAALSGPTEAHVAVTERCPATCRGCYADARADAHEPTWAELAERLRALAAMGTFAIAFGGGEAALRADLAELGALARDLGMTPTVTTSGIGVDADRARAMRVFAQVNVSHDGVDGGYRAVRGFSGAGVAERAIAHLRAAGIPVGVNTVVTRESFEHLEATAARAEELGAIEIQLVRWKPSGRGRLDYLARRLDPERVARFPAVLRRMSTERTIGIRVDCALVPFLAVDPEIRPDDLVRFGVMGCEAGRSLLAVRADGATAGCSFWRHGLAASAPGVALAWDDPALARLREHHARAPEPCASCPVRASCRGGCRIVAEHVSGDPFAPDPECPRVRAHARAAIDQSAGSRAMR